MATHAQVMAEAEWIDTEQGRGGRGDLVTPDTGWADDVSAVRPISVWNGMETGGSAGYVMGWSVTGPDKNGTG